MMKFYIWKYLIITIGHSHTHPWWIAIFPSRNLVHQLGGKQTSLPPFLTLRVGIPFGKIVVIDYYYPGVIIIMFMIYWWEIGFGPYSLGAPVSSRSGTNSISWNDSMKKVINTLESVITKKIKIFNGLPIRNGGRGLIKQLLLIVRTVLPRLTKSGVVQVVVFSFFLSRLIRNSGSKGAVLYLKTCQVLLQQSVAGYRVHDISDLKMRVKRTKSGLPRVIPAGARRMIIRDRNIRVIRLWMTLFGIFRIMEFKGSLSFSTITDPGVNLNKVVDDFRQFLKNGFIPNLRGILGAKIPSMPPLSLFPILKSGPTSVDSQVSSSLYSMVWSARILLRSPRLESAIKLLSSGLGFSAFYNRIELAAMSDNSRLQGSLSQTVVKRKSKDPTLKDVLSPASYYQLFPKGEAFLGKLGFKIEPAGKVRVFAMVDPWTQWLLAPIHKFIFSILRELAHVDGTFDQLKPIERLQAIYTKCKKFTIYSIDLSAATDRLPIAIQVVLLEELLSLIYPRDKSKEMAIAWSDLLVGRQYEVKLSSDIKTKCYLPSIVPRGLLYQVGQPMGALSSWAMLAITHHAIIQFSAWRMGIKTWFTHYGVLGDDMTIVGKVATAYRQLLRELGVKAGLAKSIISRNKFVVEFAKKFFVDSTRADMVPFKEAIATQTSTALVLEFTRKYQLNLNQILAFLGYGYKARSWVRTRSLYDLSTRLRVLAVWLSSPLSPLGSSSEDKWISWLEMFSLSSRMEAFPKEVYDKILPILLELVDRKINLANSAMDAYQKSIHDVSDTLDKESPIMVTGHYQPLGWSGPGLGEKSLVSWTKVFDPDLTNEVDVSYQGGLHDLDHDLAVKPVISMEWRNVFMHHWEVSNMLRLAKYPQYDRFKSSEIAMQLINSILDWLFMPHPLQQDIPKEFWPEERTDEKEFRDFLQVYKIWSDLSKPLWQHHYKNKYDLENRGLNPSQSSPKSYSLVAVENLIDHFDGYQSPLIWERDDIKRIIERVFAPFEGKKTWYIYMSDYLSQTGRILRYCFYTLGSILLLFVGWQTLVLPLAIVVALYDWKAALWILDNSWKWWW